MKKILLFICLFLASSLASANYVVEMVKDINKGSASSGLNVIDYQFTMKPQFYNGRFYYAAKQESTGVELWQTDATSSGTQIVADNSPGELSGLPVALTKFNGRLFYATYDNSGQPYRAMHVIDSNGSRVFTSKMRVAKNLCSNLSGVDKTDFVVHDGKLFFVGYTDEMGAELWQTDGTEEGTHIVGDINLGLEGGAEYVFLRQRLKDFFFKLMMG